jgi:cytochrome c oxidase assembly protein subunit 15
VLGHALSLSAAVLRRGADVAPLRPSARVVGVLVVAQVVLGLLALALLLPLGGNPRTPTLWQAMTRTAHQTNGALLLASTLVLALRAFRTLRPLAVNEPTPRAVEAVA